MNYWLMKSEPQTWDVDSFQKEGKSLWDGVRNHQAKNFMKKDMKKGDLFLFYHSSCKAPGVYALGKISKTGLKDPSAFDKKSPYFDPRSKKDEPTWFCVEVSFLKKLKKPVSLKEIRGDRSFSKMELLKKGNRLSIQPVKSKEFQKICKMGGVSWK